MYKHIARKAAKRERMRNGHDGKTGNTREGTRPREKGHATRGNGRAIAGPRHALPAYDEPKTHAMRGHAGRIEQAMRAPSARKK